MSVLCSSALGSSLPLLEPAALKGDWQLAAIGDGKTVCEVQLSDEAVANTNAFRFTASAQCLQPLALHALPVAWRPTPDGMTLTDAEGSMVAFLALTAPKRYELIDRNGPSRFVLIPR
ncbi:MAG: protease inhibitor Inh/omp19 family protein [Serratia marcescens]|uniref:protease inhibitor Inh/omp19 family protein n=1 Tax=Serratia TaxID=613 RepID=UPI0007C73296|nr:MULTISPECIES: protease inhibitor Inh/omp19 family protein [Serratia]AOE99280.1 peptidase [Serratia surfactantfaciens]MDU3785730.1 protease inhibitor Inh/omp19 family protein [Serratia marcescens]MDU3851749.1 protease inhibitor Inh/omp19 family protein [Serratia marcescens]MTD05328.1 AprI/Inh family metalloprotease inhibitor [Serratia sp. YC16]